MIFDKSVRRGDAGILGRSGASRGPIALVMFVAICLSISTGTAAEPRRPARPQKEAMLMKMPGESFKGPLPPLTDDETLIRDELKREVQRLAGEIGERNVQRHARLQQTADYIEKSLADTGYKVNRQVYQAKGRSCCNLDAELAGADKPAEIVLLGAHYDSVTGAPGANDNGSGMAAVLVLARRLKDAKPGRTLRFAAFTNEEQPYFQSDLMGSLVYARRCRDRKENIVAMLSLETIGYYSDAKDSQKYPPPFSLFYPSTGNFIGFVGNPKSSELVTRTVTTFRKHAKFPSEGGALPESLAGVGWSDHWSFWQAGYPALMVTDTAPFRYPHYHKLTDTPDKLDYDRMARVVAGLEHVVRELATANAE